MTPRTRKATTASTTRRMAFRSKEALDILEKPEKPQPHERKQVTLTIRSFPPPSNTSHAAFSYLSTSTIRLIILHKSGILISFCLMGAD